MGLYGGRKGVQLTITDALTTGYRFLLKPDFSIPILVIGVVVNLVVIAIFVPFIVNIAVGDTTSEDGLPVRSEHFWRDWKNRAGRVTAGAV